MLKKIKKTIAIVLCLMFLTTIFTNVNALEVKKKAEEDIEEENIETITFYRIGIDDSITTVSIDINLEENKDIEEILEDECRELFEKDPEFQSYIQDEKENLNDEDEVDNLGLLQNFIGAWGILLVSSRGKGLHLKTKPIYSIYLKLNLLKLKLPRFIVRKIISLMFCRYPEDPNSKTTIIPLIRTSINPCSIKKMTGNHSVYVHRFMGYTTWLGRKSCSPLDIIPRAFYGIARRVVCHKLP